MTSIAVTEFTKLVEETDAVHEAGSRPRLSVTVTAPRLPTVPMVVPTAPEPRSTGPSGTVTPRAPVDVTSNVTMVPSEVPGPAAGAAGAAVSARPEVAAVAGRAVAMMSAPAATPPAVIRNSGLRM